MPQVAWAPWRARSDFTGGVRAARTPPMISSEEMVENRVRDSVSAVHVIRRVSTCVENRMPPPPAEERPGPMAYVVRFRL